MPETLSASRIEEIRSYIHAWINGGREINVLDGFRDLLAAYDAEREDAARFRAIGRFVEDKNAGIGNAIRFNYPKGVKLDFGKTLNNQSFASLDEAADFLRKEKQ